MARGLMATLGGRYALVVGHAALSRLMDQRPTAPPVLFGDGAGAAICELCDAPVAIAGRTRGDEAIPRRRPCTGSAPIWHGRACCLPLCSGRNCPLSTRCWTERSWRWTMDWAVPSGQRIVSHCVKALHADAAKFYRTLDRHGNTSAAQHPGGLNGDGRSGLLKAGQKVSCIGFGGGEPGRDAEPI